ncbi:MAG TPA: class I SAM-dependent methyltransferase, partial [Nitrososphaerales archaeon]|nr:class I SAM-dependent methyltransferase [Nitrososphaerales archaeon]
IDDHRTIIELFVAGALAVGVGFVISAYTRVTNPQAAELGLIVGPSVGFLILVVASALFWSSRLGKAREMRKLVSSIPWGGEEVVLDLGCGRGLAMVDAAKRLDTGYAIGVDTWPKSRLSGNDPRSIWANAEVDKVGDKMVPVRGLALNLPFADGSIDVVLSGVAVHRLASRREREALFSEIHRVLRDGGRVGILDAGNGNQYASMLRALGLLDVEMHRLRFSSFPPFHVVIGRKPYGA